MASARCPCADPLALHLPFAPLPRFGPPHTRTTSPRSPSLFAYRPPASHRTLRHGFRSVHTAPGDPMTPSQENKVTDDGLASWSALGRLLCLPELDSSTDRFLSAILVTHSEERLPSVLVPSCSCSVSAAVQSTPPPRQKQEDPRKQDYHVNVGYAIRTLREELPAMFYKDLNYDIYRDDIVFRDPMNTFGGIENYKSIFWALRFQGRIFFKALWVEIFRVWQPSDNVIMVRWQVRGVPRVPWEAQGIFDGTSEYKLDKDGMIYEHKVDNVALNSRPKFKVPTVADLVRATGCSSTPKPTFFGKLEMGFWLIFPYLLQFTWVRYYLALKGTMVLRIFQRVCNVVGA